MAEKIADERIWQKEKQVESPTGEWTGEWTGECEGQFWERARKLTASLTLEEKIGMIHGAQLFQTKGVERLGIPPLVMSDGPMGVRQEFQPDEWRAIGHTDDYVTYLPCNSALAATWNRKLAKELGSVLGEEARGRGKDVILAPGINLKRSPLCGRNFEYLSEDPCLTGELAISLVKGIQKWDVAACVKHFAVNNQETERLWMEVKIDEEALRALYLPAFYDALKKGGSYTVMGAYNRLYGEHCCQSQYLLGDILRKEWGYDGVVISDWGGVHDTEAAANSQLDIEMSVTSDFDEYHMADPLKKAIEEGRIPEKAVDEKVTRILVLMMRLHMLDGERKSGAYNTEGHRQSALAVARESVVLLKNQRGQLPLSREGAKRVLVIGENGECIHSNGGGSAEIKALYEISPLMGIKKCLGGNARVDFLPGYCRDMEEKPEEDEINWQAASLGSGRPAGDQERGQETKQETKQDLEQKRARLRQEAISAAASSSYDQVIFIGGLNHQYDCEGQDRADMKLPYGQDQLISGLLKARPDTVVVLMGGSPVEMGEWIGNAGSLVWCWYGGMEGGTALAEVLYGLTNPSGKLPESFYRKIEDCPAHAIGEFGKPDQAEYREGVYVGYRYLDAYQVEPEFCFGHGLSYTDFSYQDGRLVEENGDWHFSCLVTNVGKRHGAETVQLYVRPLKKSEDGGPGIFQELKNFEKVELDPGESRMVFMKLEENPEGSRIAVGASSRDIRILL